VRKPSRLIQRPHSGNLTLLGHIYLVKGRKTHLIGSSPPTIPTTQATTGSHFFGQGLTQNFGGTPKANAAANADAWSRILQKFDCSPQLSSRSPQNSARSLEEVLAPFETSSYDNSDDVLDAIFTMVGEQAIGRKSYSDRTPPALGEDRPDDELSF
jgi:hypothetical protein